MIALCHITIGFSIEFFNGVDLCVCLLADRMGHKKIGLMNECGSTREFRLRSIFVRFMSLAPIHLIYSFFLYFFFDVIGQVWYSSPAEKW